MILQLNCKGHGIGLRLPVSLPEVKQTLSTLRDGLAPSTPIRINDVCGDICYLYQYIKHANLESETDVQKLNQLAETVDRMSTQEQHILHGALDAESVNGLDDVLQIAGRIGQYEFIEGVTSDKELGGWLVEHGLAGVDFPETVRPYLDYAGIGAEYYANHGGAYTPNGYVKRRDIPQEQAVVEKSKFALTLMSISDTYRLSLPASDDELERARLALKVNSLGGTIFSDVEIVYPWAHLLPLDSITLEDANTLAQYVQQMSESELRVFGAALEVEEPDSFPDAVCIAEELDNYELVSGSEGEYGREALRYAGAGDEILEMLDDFTDFDALGRCEMEQDGVRETSFGSIKRLTTPFPQPDIGPTMC